MHPNEKLVRDGYDAFVRGDVEAVASLLAPEVVWHVGGTGSLAGDYKGHGDLFDLLGRLADLTGGSISISARDILTSDDHIIVLTTMRARRGDRELDDDGVAVFRIDEGRAAEVWVFAENQGAMDEFFGA